MTNDELARKLAEAQDALYALLQAENLTLEQQIELMRVHGNIGDCVYAAMTDAIASPIHA
jgi:hypothetical protein